MSLVRFKECLFLHTCNNRSHLFETDTYAQCDLVKLSNDVPVYRLSIGGYIALLTSKDAKRALEFLDETSET